MRESTVAVNAQSRASTIMSTPGQDFICPTRKYMTRQAGYKCWKLNLWVEHSIYSIIENSTIFLSLLSLDWRFNVLSSMRKSWDACSKVQGARLLVILHQGEMHVASEGESQAAHCKPMLCGWTDGCFCQGVSCEEWHHYQLTASWHTGGEGQVHAWTTQVCPRVCGDSQVAKRRQNLMFCWNS